MFGSGSVDVFAAHNKATYARSALTKFVSFEIL